jgi:hypothetical protein
MERLSEVELHRSGLKGFADRWAYGSAHRFQFALGKRMRRRGLIRLWIVVTAIFVPAVAFWQVNDFINTWQKLDNLSIQICVNQETATFDEDKCARDAGVGQTAFQHEHTTAGAYWAGALGIAFLLDLALTGLLIGAFLAVRWVARGFKARA